MSKFIIFFLFFWTFNFLHLSLSTHFYFFIFIYFIFINIIIIFIYYQIFKKNILKVLALEGKMVLQARCGWLHTLFLVSNWSDSGGTATPAVPSNQYSLYSAMGFAEGENSTASDMGIFQLLPNEIVIHLYSFFSPKDLGILAQVNSTFR